MDQVGFSLAALKRHIRKLIEAGIISMKDSPNGKRWGKGLRRESRDLKEVVAEQALELRLLKKSMNGPLGVASNACR